MTSTAATAIEVEMAKPLDDKEMEQKKGVANPLSVSDVLKELDETGIRWYHIVTICVAGMGFFTDSYDLFSIGLLTKILGRIYYNGAMPIQIQAAITGVALCGTFAGQLIFGVLGDMFGRKSMYTATLVMMIISALASGFSFGRKPEEVIGTLCFFRFFLGIGVGGDYPLSATIMSEYSSKSHRGAFVAAVFAMQGLGILASGIVVLITTSIVRNTMAASPQNADLIWRSVLMFAAVPTAATLYLRMKMPETPRYTLLIEGDKAKANENMGQVLQTQVSDHTGVRRTRMTFSTFVSRNKWKLLGCASTWFFLDIAFYSQNLFQSQVFSTIGWVPKIKVYWNHVDRVFTPPQIHPSTVCSNTHWVVASGVTIHGTKYCPAFAHNKLKDCISLSSSRHCWMNPVDETFLLARAQTILALGSTIPGYWFTVFTIEYMGRWVIQVMGFAFMTLFMGILAGKYPYLVKHTPTFVTLYALTFFFANWGPNATTFVVPAEVFPSRWRTTAHGFCAACGKAGAIIGAFGFLYASQNPKNPANRAQYGNVGIGLQNSLIALTAINAAGLVMTIFFVPESKGISLEELNEEGQYTRAEDITDDSTVETETKLDV